jgi:hypothetical protein
MPPTHDTLLAVWEWVSTHGLQIAAIALSPLIALRISAARERKRDGENRKLAILQTLMATRHSPFADDRIRALNIVDVLFYDNATVRTAHRALMMSLSKSEGLNPDGTVDKKLSDEWNERQWDLVSAMAAVLRLPMTKADFEAGYAPKALNEARAQQALLIEVNKSLIMFARKDLGLKWNPAALFQLPDDVGIIGPYKEPPPAKDEEGP